MNFSLNVGQIVGISVSVSLLAIILIIVIIYYVRERRRNQMALYGTGLVDDYYYSPETLADIAEFDKNHRADKAANARQRELNAPFHAELENATRRRFGIYTPEDLRIVRNAARQENLRTGYI